LVAKNLDMIVANDVTVPNAGFGVETNQVMILSREGGREELPLMSKATVADAVLDRLLLLLTDQPTSQKDEEVSR
jgi:phosphopantothenoylcysteine decarboxylase/phosphopantothenate--cysteine ligase